MSLICLPVWPMDRLTRPATPRHGDDMAVDPNDGDNNMAAEPHHGEDAVADSRHSEEVAAGPDTSPPLATSEPVEKWKSDAEALVAAVVNANEALELAAATSALERAELPRLDAQEQHAAITVSAPGWLTQERDC
jgi:hypothetical protein